MSEAQQDRIVVRKVSPLERMLIRSPYAIVTMVARIKGDVTEKMLMEAVSKVQKRHLNLRVRIEEDEDHISWFTSEEVRDIPVEIVARKSDEHWIQVFHEACRVPFDFDQRPAIRFILVQSSALSELILFCHHVLCDGMSLAYLARDLMLHLGDPDLEVEVLSDPVPIDKDHLPEDVSLNAVVKFLINRINKGWEKDKIFFDQEDYRSLNEAYWSNFKHDMLSIELSESQTSALVERCRNEGVTVNSALTAAFAGAQQLVRGEPSYHATIAVAGDLRNRLLEPPGEGMGFYAGVVTLEFKYNTNIRFWENARRLHQDITPRYTNKNLFHDPLTWCYLAPGILESFSYKVLGHLVPARSPRYHKLSSFSKRDDVVSSILKRENMDSLDKTVLGTAVTNLTRLDFPRAYGSLELDRLIMNPGGAFPLANVDLVLGAVTCAGKLSLLLEFVEDNMDFSTAHKIEDKAMQFLLSEQT